MTSNSFTTASRMAKAVCERPECLTTKNMLRVHLTVGLPMYISERAVPKYTPNATHNICLNVYRRAEGPRLQGRGGSCLSLQCPGLNTAHSTSQDLPRCNIKHSAEQTS